VTNKGSAPRATRQAVATAPGTFDPNSKVIGRTVAWLARQIELGLSAVELTAAQYRALSMLASEPTGSTALADFLAVRPPSITSMVDGLVSRGLVQRHSSEEDRRCVSHTLTDAGRHALVAADDALATRLREIADYLNDEEATAAIDSLALWQRALVARRAERRAR
jgi:long-chain acyl-CoA synthetase